jgi:uncharacterized C2H2 Zn-finger protein
MAMNNSITTLLQLISNNPRPVHTTGQWREQKGEGKIYCPKCSSLYRRRFPQPIDIILSHQPEGTIGGAVYFTAISVFHRIFIEQIREHLPEKEFSIGRCFSVEGDLIKDYVTCYSRKYLIVHGGKGTEYEVCPVCDSVRRMKFTRPANIPRIYLSDARVYMDRSCNMFFDEELALGLDYSPWPGAKFQAYPVEENILDKEGFPDDI